MRQEITLNGTWQATFVQPGVGEDRRLFVEPLAVGGWFDANVPGDIHTDLQRHAMIEDPYVADNLEKCRWTQEQDCWLYRTLRITPEMRSAGCVELEFDGLDTIAQVWINDRVVGRCANMHRQFRFDITHLLPQEEECQLTVKLAALNEARRPWRGQNKYRAIKDVTRVFFRKPQCQFGWDWSPEFGSLGIWKDVRLVMHEGVRINSVQVETRTSGQVTVYTVLSRGIRDANVHVTVEGHSESLQHTRPLTGTRTFTALQLDNPQIWQPAGYGQQPLYHCHVQLERDGEILDEQVVRFGVRELGHVERRISNDEVAWHLLVNGREVFCQGANWVPPDILPGATPPERYRTLLTRAREAGFNMLRIWGGGLYESDLFYDLCDELGIMVWQDFAFANADYPLEQEEFRNNVTAEIDSQVRRLRNHPALAIWCGGNEKSSSFEIEHTIDDGFDLFGVHIPGLLNLLDRTRPYIISSPIAYTDIGNDRSSGNSHTSVWLWAYFDNVNVEPFRAWLNPAPAFKSEFFLMGAPRAESFRRMLPGELTWPPNDVWGYRFRGAPEWNKGAMVSFHEYQMNTIEKFFGRPEDLSEFLKRSSVCQRELAREEFEHTRCHRQRCGGSLFWMMNDTWPGATWALVDFYGVPKPVFYALKRACAPLLCTMTLVDPEHYALFVVNETEQEQRGSLELRVCSTADGSVEKHVFDWQAVPHSSQQVACLPVERFLDPAQWIYLQADNGQCTFDNYYYPCLWKGLQLRDPELQVQVSEIQPAGDGWAARIILRSTQLARCVYLDLDPLNLCVWSDNFFDLGPEHDKEVQVWCPREFGPGEIRIGHWLTAWA